MSESFRELIEYDLNEQIRVIQKARKQALGELQAIEDGILSLLRAIKFILEKLDKIEAECRGRGETENE